MTSVLWQLMQSIQTTLQGMSFTVQGADSVGDIPADNIVIRKVGMGARADETKNLPQIATPAIVITPPRKWTRPINFGGVQTDWVVYPVLVEIVDNDASDRTNNLETYMKWEQQIARAFSCHDFLDIDVSSSCAYSFVETVNTWDLKLWLRSPGVMVAGVVVMIYSKETRGIEA